jgi:hypothetical protein
MLQSTIDYRILERVMKPKQPFSSDAAAESFLNWSFPESDVTRMNHLSEKARDGTLTTRESEELDSYGRVGCLLSILKVKAESTLKRQSKRVKSGPAQ